MRRTAALALALALLLALTACGAAGSQPSEETAAGTGQAGNTELTLWTFPVGGWGNSGTVSTLISAFHRENAGIRVSVKVLD